MDTATTLHKKAAEKAAANLVNYRWVRHDFSWLHARDAWLSGIAGPAGANLGYKAVDRHLPDLGDKTAIRYVSADGDSADLTYAELERRTSRFAGLLAGIGLRRGETVAIVGGGLDQVVSILGALRFGAVAAPAPDGLGDASLMRCLSGAAAMVIGAAPYEQSVAPMRRRLISLRHVLVTTEGRPPAHTRGLAAGLACAADTFRVPMTEAGIPALAHHDGSRLVVHTHGAAVPQYVSGLYALDLKATDVVWCTARYGTIGATTYGIIVPLLHGATSVISPFDAAGWTETVSRHGVTVCRIDGPDLDAVIRRGAGRTPFPAMPSLRLITSDREPPDAAAVRWSADVLGRPVHDSWWRPVTGSVVISNYAGMDLRPGSVGLPLPGAAVSVVERVPGEGFRFVRTGITGEIAIRADWPGMGLRQPSDGITIRDGWYLSGSRARQDADGYIWPGEPG